VYRAVAGLDFHRPETDDFGESFSHKVNAMKHARMAAALLLGLAVHVAPARAADAEHEARSQFQNGIALYKDGDFEQAAIAFARAYELKPSYKILFNIGQVRNELKRYARALEAYTRYLSEGGTEIPPERRDQVEVEVRRLEGLVGSIVVTSAVDGATVFLDDTRQDDTPLAKALVVDMGEHVVVVRKAGVELHREKVTVAGGARVVVQVEDAKQPIPQPLPETGRGAQPPRKEEGEGSPRRVWTWVAFGVGGAAAIGAAIAGGLTISAVSDLEVACDGNDCPPSEQDTIDSGQRAAMAANVLTGIAAAGIAAGVALYFFEPDLNGTAVEIAPTASARGAGLVVGGRF
jgi:hypothetical protein